MSRLKIMNSKEFKTQYMKWSKAVAVSVPLLVVGVAICDALLGFDLSKNMYMMGFICTGVVLALLSLTWISALNLESRFMKNDVTRVVDDECITLSDIAECIKREGYIPDVYDEDDTVFFKIQGDTYRVYYSEGRFALYKHYVIDEDTDVELLKKATELTEEKIFALKIFTGEEPDGTKGILFQVSLLLTSQYELKRHFPRCLDIIHAGINFHRDRFAELAKGPEETGALETADTTQSEHRVVS